MKKIIILVSLLFAVFSSNAQCVSTLRNQSGTSILIWSISDVAVDNVGNIYVTHRNEVSKITPSGLITSIIDLSSYGGWDTSGVAIDNSGNIFVATSTSDQIFKITSTGLVTVLAGTNSGLGGIIDIAIDTSGNLFVIDGNAIRKITPTGIVTNVAYLGSGGFQDGLNPQFFLPQAIVVDSSGNLFVADTGNNRIRKLQYFEAWGSWFSETVAGDGTPGYLNGFSQQSQFNAPTGITIDSVGNLYVADGRNNRIRKIKNEGFFYSEVTTIAGSGIMNWNSNAPDGYNTNADFGILYDLTIDALGNLYVNDGGDLRKIRKIEPLTAWFWYPSYCKSVSAPQPVTLYGSGNYTGGIFSSTVGLTINSSTGAITPSTSSPGTYTVTYNTPASGNCQLTKTSQVTIHAPNTISPIFYQIPPVCQGENLVLSDTSSNGISGSWSPAANNNATTTYTFTPSPNQCALPTTMTVSVLSTPTTSISADGTVSTSTTITNGSSVQLQLNGTLNAQPNIQWTPATAISSANVANPLVYPSATTTYTASFVNSNGCPQTTSFTVNVTPQPNIGNLSLSSTNTTIGLFDTITVNVQLNNATDVFSLYMKLKGNAAVSQYLNYTGYTEGTLFGTNVISTSPTVTNEVYDFGMTKVGAVPGYSGSGLFYTFTFVPKNIAIPAGTTFCFYLDDVSAYNTSGVACGLTNQGQYCYTFTNQINVWPGDLNKSNTVTTSDLLPIGYFYNSTGPTRPNANIQWTGQPATLWGNNRSSSYGDAYKVFADSNGDGVVNNADQAAIGYNMNQVHAKMASPSDSTAPPHFTAQQLTTAAGSLLVIPNNTIINGAALPQSVTFTVNVNNTGGLSSLYGISANLLFDDTIFDLSTAIIDFTGSIFGIVETDCLEKRYISTNRVSVALTRFANAPINGQGILFKVTLQTKTTLPNLTQTPVTAYVDASNNQAGETLVIQEAPVNNLTVINNLAVNTVKAEYFILYPNPANEIVYLFMGTNATQNNDLKVKVFNMLGQMVEEIAIQNTTTELSTKNWGTAGVYFVEVTKSDNTVLMTKKVIVNRK